MESTSISGNENVRQTLFPKLFVSHNCAFVIDFFLRFRLLLASSPDHRSLLADDIQVIQPGRNANANVRCMVQSTSFCIRSGPLLANTDEKFNKRSSNVPTRCKTILVFSLQDETRDSPNNLIFTALQSAPTFHIKWFQD